MRAETREEGVSCLTSQRVQRAVESVRYEPVVGSGTAQLLTSAVGHSV